MIMSEPMEDNSKQDSPQVQVVSLDTISDIIKEAVGGVKDYIDDALTTTKRQVLDSSKIQLKFKGNRIQFEFNEKQEKAEKAISTVSSIKVTQSQPYCFCSQWSKSSITEIN